MEHFRSRKREQGAIHRLFIFITAQVASILTNPALAGNFDIYGEWSQIEGSTNKDPEFEQWSWRVRYYGASFQSGGSLYGVAGRDPILFKDGTHASAFIGLGWRQILPWHLALFGEVVKAPIVCTSKTECPHAIAMRKRLLLSWEHSDVIFSDDLGLRWAGYGEAITQSTFPENLASGWLRTLYRVSTIHQSSFDIIPIEVAVDRALGDQGSWHNLDFRTGIFASIRFETLSLGVHCSRVMRLSPDNESRGPKFFQRYVISGGAYL